MSLISVSPLIFLLPFASSSCSDMTHSECPITSDAIILQINVPVKYNCLRLCQAIGPRCDFYIYEKNSFTENCRLYRESFHTFVDNCNLIGGPKELLSKCSTFSLTDNIETSFKEGNCLYSSKEESSALSEWQHCQMLCLTTKSCNYWTFRREEKMCHLLGSSERNCLFAFGDNQSGDAKDCPKVEECPTCPVQTLLHNEGEHACKNCPINGQWGEWGVWPAKCNTTCGEGSTMRTRTCNNPSPMFGGDKCQGRKNETLTCFKKKYCSGEVTLYTGSDDNESVMCKLSWNQGKKMSKNFKKYRPCQDDQANSIVIEMANADTTIVFYDSTEKKMDYDYLTIKIKKDITQPLRITSFEKSFSNDLVNVTYMGHPSTFWTPYGLDGKVSSIFVDSQ